MTTSKEKGMRSSFSLLVAAIAPVLIGLVIPFYQSYVAHVLQRFDNPLLGLSEESSALSMILNALLAESPAILVGLIVAVSMISLLKAPRLIRRRASILAFAISAILLVCTVVVLFVPSWVTIGLTYSLSSGFLLIACFVYGALVFCSFTAKDKDSM